MYWRLPYTGQDRGGKNSAGQGRKGQDSGGKNSAGQGRIDQGRV